MSRESANLQGCEALSYNPVLRMAMQFRDLIPAETDCFELRSMIRRWISLRKKSYGRTSVGRWMFNVHFQITGK